MGLKIAGDRFRVCMTGDGGLGLGSGFYEAAEV